MPVKTSKVPACVVQALLLKKKKEETFPSWKSYIEDHSPECSASYSFYLLCSRPATVQGRSTYKRNKALHINSSTCTCINLSRIKTIMFTLLITTLLQRGLTSPSFSWTCYSFWRLNCCRKWLLKVLSRRQWPLLFHVSQTQEISKETQCL